MSNHTHTWQAVPKAGHNLKQCSACLLYIGAVYIPKRKLLTGKVRKELEGQLEALRTDYKRGKLDPALKNLAPLTFEEACRKYSSLYMVPNDQETDKYFVGYKRKKDGEFVPGYFEKFIGSKTLVKSITGDRLQQLKAKMLADYAPSTFIRRWTLLNSIFRELIPTYLSSNPCKLISNKAIRKRVSRKDTARQRWLTEKEMQRVYYHLLNYVRTEKNAPVTDPYPPNVRRENYLFAVVARNTGLRPDSMDRLEWKDLNLDSDMLRARETKNGHTYDLHMNKACREALLELWEMKGKPSQGLVFRKTDWSRIFTKLFRRLGWNDPNEKDQDNAVLYTLRHTFCSHLVMKGYSGKPLWDAMGWENGSEEATYSHLSPKFKNTMVNTVNSAYEPLGDKLLEEAKRGKDENEDEPA